MRNQILSALLNQKQRAALAQAYAIYNKALDKIEENAAGVAETINGLADLLAKAKAFAKNYKGGKAEAAKAKAYEENIKKAQKALLKNKDVPDSLKTALVANQATAQPAWDFYKTGQACTVSGNSGGGDAFFRLPLADCGGFSKAVEDEAEAINNAKNSFGCNCVLGHCNEVTAIFNKVIAGNSQKSDYISLGTGDFPLLSGVAENSGSAINSGIDAGKNCFQVKIEKKFNTGTASLDLKNYIKLPAENKIVLNDERGEAGVEISLLSISKGTLNDLERYLRFGGKKPDDGGYTPPEGAVDVSLLKTSELGKKMLRISEGCTATAPKKDRREGYLYVDSKGYCTFGIGHLIRKGDCTKEDEADWGKKTWEEALVDFEDGKLKEFEDIVKRHVKVPVTQAEFDAMISFAFNVGEGNVKDEDPKNDGFQGSSFIETLNGTKKGKPKGTREPDLMKNFKDNPNRRKSEVELFKMGDYKHYPGGKDIATTKIPCDGK